METALRASFCPLATNFSIHVFSSEDSSRHWLLDVVFLTGCVFGGGTEDGCGWSRTSFLEAKSCTRREGTPAVTLQWCPIRRCMLEGRASVVGRTRSMSQDMLRARRCSVDNLLGRITQRITRDTTNGDNCADFSVERKDEIRVGVVWQRAMRWRVQRGMLDTDSALS